MICAVTMAFGLKIKTFATVALFKYAMCDQEHHVCLALAGWSRKHSEPLKAVDSQCSHVALEEVVFVLSFLTTGHLFTTENDVRVDISEHLVTLHH